LRATAWNLRYHELIGLEVEVIRHPDASLAGLRGRVVWETPRALLVEASGGRQLLILKSGALLAFRLPGGERVVLRGDDLLGGPVDRLKKLRR
jgi:ribonuclease P protein subunit POP4